MAPLERGSLRGFLGIIVDPHSIRERQPLESFHSLTAELSLEQANCKWILSPRS